MSRLNETKSAVTPIILWIVSISKGSVFQNIKSILGRQYMHFDSDSDKDEKESFSSTYPTRFMLLDPSLGLMPDQL